MNAMSLWMSARSVSGLKSRLARSVIPPPIADRRVVLRTPERVRVVDDGSALRLAPPPMGLSVDDAAHGKRRMRVGRVLDPLGLARLACDHRDRVRRRGRILGGENLVEDRETAGEIPK